MSGYPGKVGQRLELVARCVRITVDDSRYWLVVHHRFEDAAGNQLVWRQSGDTSPFEEGRSYRIRGTVKAHRDHHGSCVTVLTRVRAD